MTDASTAQIANLRRKRRTKPIGPRSASTAATTPKTSFQSQIASKPNSLSHSSPAAVAITISSNTAQPRHWTMFNAVGRYEPRRPSGARISTIVGTRASAPISAATASIALPMTAPTSVAASAVPSGRSKYAGRTSTSSEMPRFVQSSVVSSVPSTRRRSGTGSIPQLGVSCKGARSVPRCNGRVCLGNAYAVASAHDAAHLHRERGSASPGHQSRHAAALGPPGAHPRQSRLGQPACRLGPGDRSAARRRRADSERSQPARGRRARREDRGTARRSRARGDPRRAAGGDDHARVGRGAGARARHVGARSGQGNVGDGGAMKRLLALAALFLVLPASLSAATPITVLGAASLTDVFPRIDKAPRYSFAGSDQLALQIRQGAPADIYAAASAKYTQLLYRDGLLLKPVVFATNKLILLVPRSNPARIKSVYDLRRSGLKIVVGDKSVPIGSYTRQILDALGITNDVMTNVVSQESDVKGIVSKVALGEADAGFVYRTDARPVSSRARTISLPAWAQPPIRYEIAVVKSSGHLAAARGYIKKVTSVRGRKLLAAAGFGLPKKP